MYLLHQELARAQLAHRQQEAHQARRSYALASHQRWHRRAERAAHRAQLALAAL
jgi:hypothetical protein